MLTRAHGAILTSGLIFLRVSRELLIPRVDAVLDSG